MFHHLTRKLERFSNWSSRAGLRGNDDNSRLSESVIEALELEARILYSAAPVPLDLAIDGPTEIHSAEVEFVGDAGEFDAGQDLILSSDALGQFDVSQQAMAYDYSDDMGGASGQLLDLVFVDEGVADDQQLIDGVWSQMPNALIFRLSSNQDGIEAITSILAERTDVRSVHILSHGEAGEVQLGNASLSSESLTDYADQLKLWKNSLTSDADVFFYGCELAADELGEQLVDDIAQLTGADVAASDDLTGHDSLGGDWDLEYTVGHIDSDIVASSSIISAWEHTLAVAQSGTVSTDISSEGDSNDSTTHTTLAGLDRLLLVGVSFGQDNGETVSSITYNGDSLFRAGALDNSDDNKSRVEIWYRVAPDVGTDLDLDITYSGNGHEGVTYGIISFTGVDQSDPLGAFTAEEDKSLAPSVTVPSANGEFVFGVVALHNSDLSITPGAGQTELWDLNQDKANGGASLEAGSNSVATSWTVDRDEEWVAAGVSIRPVALIAPETQAASGSGNEDTSVSITLTGTDADGTVDSFSLSTLPSNGMLYTDAALMNAVANGVDYAAASESLTLFFDPDTDWNGTTNFSFSAKDDDGQSDSSPATATITVSSVNDAPETQTAVASGNEDTSVSVTLTGSDLDGTVNSFSLSTLPSNGLLYTDAALTNAVTTGVDYAATSESLTLFFAPAANWHGTANFTYSSKDNDGQNDLSPSTGTITISSVNDDPQITSNGGGATAFIDVDENQTFVTTVTASDADNPSTALNYSIVGGIDASSFVIDSVSGDLAFVVAKDFENPTDFNFDGDYIVRVRVNDGTGGSDDQLIVVDIKNANERPYVASNIGDLVIDEDNADLFLNLRDVFEDNEDSDSDLTYTIENVTNAGIFTSVSVTPSDFNALAFAANQNGMSIITIRATDTGGLFVDTTANITINPVNDDPFVASPVSPIVVDEDSADTLINLDGVFDDVDILTNGDSLSYSVISNTNGTLVAHSITGNQLTLDYLDNQFGNSTITVRATDSFGRTTDETINVTVNGVNDDPNVSSPINRTANEDDSPLTINLLDGATDADPADSLTVSNLVLASGDSRGVSLMGNSLNVDPNAHQDLAAGQSVTIEYTYSIIDGNGGSVGQTATIVIMGANDAPTVVSSLGQIDANEDDPLTPISLASVFADIDDPTLTYRLVSSDGTWLAGASVVGSNLVLDYQENQYGQAQIVIEAVDSGGQVATDTVTLNVLAVNDRPEVINQVFSSADGGVTNSIRQITGNLLTGATDIENDGLTVNLIGAPDNGVIDLNPDGTFTFTPDANFIGVVSIEFEASDGVDVSNRGTATFITDPLPIPSPTETSPEDSEDDEEQLVPVTLQQLPEAQVKEAAQVSGSIPATFASFQSKVSVTESDDSLVAVNTGSDVSRSLSSRQFFSSGTDEFVRSSIDDIAISSFDYSAEFSASLTAFGRDLDEAGRDLEFSQLSTVVSISGVSIGFMSLVLRTGALVASMMVNVPAWRVMDPLCVLGYSDDDADEEDESLLDIVESENIGSTCKVPPPQRTGRSRLTPLQDVRQHASPIG